MEQIINQFNLINKLLIKNAQEKNDPGLIDGKLGLCLYFYSLARETQDSMQQEIADRLMGEVYESAGRIGLSTSFDDGLAGIAWGISYLVKNDFIDADLDEALSEVDDRLYRFIEENLDKLPVNLKKGILGYLFYCLYRYENISDAGSGVNQYIFKMLGVKLINRLGQMIEEEKFLNREPLLFNIYWDLPVIMIMLAKSMSLGINPDKAERIIEYLSPVVISLLPRLHANRLYLLWGMESVLEVMKDETWRDHADFLRDSIDQERIITQECKNLNIAMLDGISGMAWIGRELATLTNNPAHSFSTGQVVRKVRESVVWGDIEFYNKFKKSISLISGLSGVGMLFLEYLTEMKSD